MIYDMQMLNNMYSEYSNVLQKVSSEVKKNKMVKIKRGLYSDDIVHDCPVIANYCYGPSYLSFEFALSYYGLIPEYVRMYTSACFGKKNNKKITIPEATFEYRSIPDDAFPFGIRYLETETKIRYRIASPEKALCDMLYSKYPVRSIKDLKILLFEDLRIDEDEFMKLDFEVILDLTRRYHSNTLLTLAKYIEGVKR